MSISIQTNVSSLVAQENLRVNNDFSNRTIERLTSGYRINASGDDAAGLAVANGYRSSVAELTQGVRNANDGVSTLQIVDGGLNNITKMLDRLKTLAAEAATDTFKGDRLTLDGEYQDLLGEIDRQAGNIGLAVGGDSLANLSVYIGGGTGATGATVTIDLSGAQVDAAGLALDSTSVTDTTTATAAIAAIDAALGTLGTVQGTVGSGQNKLHYGIQLAQSQISSFSAAESRIRDADVAAEASNLTKAQVLQQASLAAMAQANAAPQAVLALLK
jgi:flagellin